MDEFFDKILGKIRMNEILNFVLIFLCSSIFFFMIKLNNYRIYDVMQEIVAGICFTFILIFIYSTLSTKKQKTPSSKPSK